MNRTFFIRYIQQNAYNRAMLKNVRVQPEHSFLKRLYNKILLRYYLAIELIIYLFSKELRLPQIELVLTTKCTLRCKNCFNMMPYFDNTTHYNVDIDDIQTNLEKLLKTVREIKIFYILGGEPLMVKELPTILEYLAQKKQLPHIEIVTNSTIVINDTLLAILKQYRQKLSVAISDYSSNPLLINKLHIEKNREILKKNNIKYEIRGSGEQGFFGWKDFGRIYKRNRDKKGIIQNFIACKMPCVSMMSSRIHVCPVSSSLYQLQLKNALGGGGWIRK